MTVDFLLISNLPHNVHVKCVYFQQRQATPHQLETGFAVNSLLTLAFQVDDLTILFWSYLANSLRGQLAR